MEPDWLDSSELKVVPNKKGKCIHGRDKQIKNLINNLHSKKYKK